MLSEIIAGITLTTVFIGFSISKLFKPTYENSYTEIGITEYYELKWFDDDYHYH